MLRALRKLRFRNLKDGDFSATLVYALLEVFLVVLGILLALQVNNWKEARSNRDIEQEYLEALHDEFSGSLADLEKLRASVKSCRENATQLVQAMTDKNSSNSTSNYGQLLGDAFKYNLIFHPSVSVLQDLINSGNLNKISSNKIRQSLTGWNSRLTAVARQEDFVEDMRLKALDVVQTEGSIVPVLEEGLLAVGLDVSGLKVSNDSVWQSQQLQNHILFFIVTAGSLEYDYARLADQCSNILKLIESEI